MKKEEFLEKLIDMGGSDANLGTWESGWDEAISDVIEIAKELDEPEKPVIPQFIANWIDAHNLYGNNPLREYRDLEIDFNEGWTDEEDAAVYHWVNKNPYAFIDALRYGCEVQKEKKHCDYDNRDGCKVEKEKRYYVFDSRDDSYLGFNSERTELEWHYYAVDKESFTEAEIKDIDEKFWDFAKEMEE